MSIPLNDSLDINKPEPIDPRTEFGAGCKYATKEAIPVNKRYATLVTTDVESKQKWGFAGSTVTDADWIEIVAPTKEFTYEIQFSNTLDDAKILAENDFTIDSENHDSNVTDVRVGVNTTPINSAYPIEVTKGDIINIGVTTTVVNQVSVVNLKCTKM